MKKQIILIIFFAIIGTISSQMCAQTRWVAPKNAGDIVNPLKNNVNETKNGKKLFTQFCVICHGSKGKGDGVAAVALNPKPANFSNKDIQNQTDGAFFWKITEGRAPMASYKESLNETQRWQLINYIRTFKK